MKLLALIAAAHGFTVQQPVQAQAPAPAMNMASNPMLMYSLLAGDDTTDMKSLLPFMMMGQSGNMGSMLPFLMAQKSDSIKELLPFMMMNGSDMNSMLPFLMLSDSSSDLKVTFRALGYTAVLTFV